MWANFAKDGDSLFTFFLPFLEEEKKKEEEDEEPQAKRKKSVYTKLSFKCVERVLGIFGIGMKCKYWELAVQEKL